MSFSQNLGYGQLKALKLLKDSPNMPLLDLCAAADCSWQESFDLADQGLIVTHMDPQGSTAICTTAKGLAVLEDAAKNGLTFN